MFRTRVLAGRVSLLTLLMVQLAGAGCAPGRHTVRLQAADGQARTTTPPPRPPLALPKEEVRQAIRALAQKVVPVADPLEFARERFEIPLREGTYLLNARTKELRPADRATEATEEPPPELVEQARRYLQWCEGRHEPGDCLGALRGRRTLDAHGRYLVAMGVAIAGTLEASKDSLEEMVSVKAVLGMVVAGITMYAVLWVIPEPTSKGIAAAMTIVLVGYVGVDTLYTLGRGWATLIDRADAATTFDGLWDAGEEYAKVMGANNARILVMVATAAVGSGASQLAKLLPSLPGAGQASRFAVAEGSVPMESVGAVKAVKIAKDGLTIILEPGVVLMSSTSETSGGGKSVEQVLRPPSAAEPGSPSTVKSHKNVEIVDSHGRPVGEFDEVSAGRFFEDKSAEGLAKLNPRTGVRQLTADEWAETQIYEKTVSRIENLASRATATRAAPGSPAPSLQEIKAIRHLTFRLRSTSPEVVNAVSKQLARLNSRFPGWTFDAIYGVQ